MKKTIFFFLLLGTNFLLAQVLPDSTQLRALEKFREDNGGNWIVRWDYTTGLPASVFGGKAEIKGNSPEITARKFLQKYSNLFKIDSDNSNLKFIGVTGNDKMNYVKFRQVYNNILVYGTEYIITIDIDGAVLSAIGRHYPVDLNCATTASLNKDEAFNRAKNDIGSSEKFKLYRSDLLILPHKGKFILAWKMDISTEVRGGSWKYFVDANSGEVLEKHRVSSDAVETSSEDSKPSEPVGEVNPAIIQPTVNSGFAFH